MYINSKNPRFFNRPRQEKVGSGDDERREVMGCSVKVSDERLCL